MNGVYSKMVLIRIGECELAWIRGYCRGSQEELELSEGRP